MTEKTNPIFGDRLSVEMMKDRTLAWISHHGSSRCNAGRYALSQQRCGEKSAAPGQAWERGSHVRQ